MSAFDTAVVGSVVGVVGCVEDVLGGGEPELQAAKATIVRMVATTPPARGCRGVAGGRVNR
jgi:hypothetical protein